MLKIEESPISELLAAMERAELSSSTLTSFYIDRINALDPALNSVIELNPDALEDARLSDKRRSLDYELRPLEGIPILLKDNICTGDKLHTSAGSLALADNIAPFDAHIVERLHNAGAIILGKTNMTELANYVSDSMPNGFSSRGGQCRNPYDPDADPGGSSTGSAVAVSSNLCAAAIGTETCGSIINPAWSNCAVGIKPTKGLISSHGIIPISSTLDTPGPITRSVSDAALLLAVLQGRDHNDPATSGIIDEHIDYTKYLDPNSLKNIRIGIIKNPNLSDALPQHLRIVEHLKLNCAACIEIDEPVFDLKTPLHSIMKFEFKRDLNACLKAMDCSPATLEAIIEFNNAHAPLALKFGQELLLEAQNLSADGKQLYNEALQIRSDLIGAYGKLFVDNDVDVLFYSSQSIIPALTGYPSMTIPVGFTQNNLPIGSFWTAKQFDEKTLIRTCYAMELFLNARRAP